MKQFLKKDQVKLINGGYVSGPKDEPVKNDDFIAAQLHAEYVVTFAEMAKGRDFKGKPADSIEVLKREVEDLLYGNKVKEYVSSPKEPEMSLTEQLKNEALAFINHVDKKVSTDKINAFLNQFNIISEFEEFGLWFKQGTVKLNKIYTMEEIVKAVKSVIDLL